nr:putative ribonuclease H-like domain-containing protein [Tanacetum cinerariifolium]
MPELEDITYSDEEDVGAEADFTNLETTITVSPIPITRVHKDHPMKQIIGDLSLAIQTRSMSKVAQDQGFEDHDHHDKVYKVVKALYGLHQALRAWYENLANYVLENGFQRGKIDQTSFIKWQKDGKSASTPIDTRKPLLKDPDGKDVDVHTYRSMIGSLMYLTSSRPDIMFAVNDVTRLQALVDKKKVIIAEATIRDALRLDDAEGIDCLPNEEIFVELSKMGAQVGDLSSHTTKYSSPALTQKVFANMKKVGKGFSGVDTPLFESMVVAQQVDKGAAEVHVDDVPAVGVADVTAAAEPIISSLTPPTQPSLQDVPSTSQVQPTPPPSLIIQPPSPQQQPQPLKDAEISMDLLHNLLDICTTLTRRIDNLEQDKIAQASKITKLKQRVKKLERRNKLKVSKLRRLKKVGTAQRVDTSDDTVMNDVSKQGRIITDMDTDVDVTLKDVADIAKEVAVDAEIEESADVQGRQAESQAQIYQIDLEHAHKVLSMQDDKVEPSELQEVVEVVTTAKLITEVVTTASATITAAALTLTTAVALILTTAPSAARRRKGVVIRDSKETATPSTIIHTEAKSKDKGKGILVEEPKPLKKQAQIEQDKAFTRELKAELNKTINWDDMIDQVQRKEKEDNAIDYFKGMKYYDIRPIFEKYFKNNVAFLEKTKEHMEEEDSRALKMISKSQEDKAAKKQKLDEEVAELKRHL